MTSADPQLVKPPQSRRGRGSSYVTVSQTNSDGPRRFVKHQTEYWCRPVWRGFLRTPMLRRELRAIRACERLGINVPEVISYEENNGVSRLTLAEVADTVSLDQALLASRANRTAIIDSAARIIGQLHKAGWSHGALYPHHILIRTSGEPCVTLIDLEKARRNPLKRSRDLLRFWRHAPELTESERAEFETVYWSVRRGG